jgi:hypothetical protein
MLKPDLFAIFAIHYDAQITPDAAHHDELYRRKDDAIRAAVRAIFDSREPAASASSSYTTGEDK